MSGFLGARDRRRKGSLSSDTAENMHTRVGLRTPHLYIDVDVETDR